MDIIIGKTAGFCFGVANAVNKTINELNNNKNNVYCLGELVHNTEVTDELQKKGLKIIDNIEEAKDNVIIRSHGTIKKTYIKAKEKNLNVIDLTCPKVLKIHNIAEKYSNMGYYIFLIGKKSHPEIIATISYCGKYASIIEDKNQVKDAINSFYKSNINKLLVIVQTTFGLEKYEEIISIIEKEIENNKDIVFEKKNTICDATRARQKETEELSKQVDMMIIIGGKHSSNTKKLYDISKINCKECVLIEKASELNINEINNNNKIGIMAGASTPKKSIDSVVELLKKI